MKPAVPRGWGRRPGVGKSASGTSRVRSGPRRNDGEKSRGEGGSRARDGARSPAPLLAAGGTGQERRARQSSSPPHRPLGPERIGETFSLPPLLFLPRPGGDALL